MYYLQIKSNKGYYWDGTELQEIDRVDKRAILFLLNSAITDDDFKMNEYNPELLGDNKAHQIIYDNLYSKLSEFLENRDKFRQEADELYNEAIGKYSAEIEDDFDFDDEEEEEGTNDNTAAMDIDLDDLPF